MKTKLVTIAALALAFSLQPSAFGQGTAFTYQGRLNDGANPANGTYDLTFALFSVSSGVGGQVGGTLTNSTLGVSNGLFTVVLDFGASFPGAARWLEIGVRTNGNAAFTTLTPRQHVTPTPYAITAENVVSGGIASGTYGNAVSFNNPNNAFSGSFTGNGANVTNVNAASLGGLALASFWQLGGNSVPPGAFLGSTNNQALEFRANGVPALRLDAGALSGKAIFEGYLYPNGAPNVIGGSPLNFVAPNVVGATIGGGGATNYETFSYSNSVSVDFATIGGGIQNTVAASDYDYTSFASTIGGGTRNTIQNNAIGSTIGGGGLNTIQPNALLSTISGGVDNQVAGQGAVVGGGGYDGNDFAGNAADGNASTIAGGLGNAIIAGATGAFIGGGRENLNGSAYSTIGGGQNNTNQPNTWFSMIGGGWLNTIQSGADQSVIAGGNSGTIQEGARESFIGGGYANTIQTNAGGAFVGGGAGNSVGINSGLSTVAGGYGNAIQANAPYAIVGGGVGNVAGAGAAFIGGGTGNTNLGGGALIGGGFYNRAENFDTVVVGGGFNVNAGYRSFIGGGESNAISESYAMIPGGYANSASGFASFAAGYRARATSSGSFVWADAQNADFFSTSSNQFSVRASGGVRLVTGGSGMTLDGVSVLSGTVPGASLAGTYGNAVTLNNAANSFSGNGTGLTALNASQLGSGTVPDARLSANVSLLGASIESAEITDGTIAPVDLNLTAFNTTFWRAGGNAGTTAGPQFLGTTDNQPLELRVNGQRGLRLEPTAETDTVNVIGGSARNFVGAGTVGATIGGGGSGNYIGVAYTNRVEADFGTVSGGLGNTIHAGSYYATIGGGQENTIEDNAYYATIGGGIRNTIQRGFYTTIGGGSGNAIPGAAEYATIAGGGGSTIEDNAHYATIGGGYQNTIQPYAFYSTIGGGRSDLIQPDAIFATIPGGRENSATDYAFAAGRRAKADHTGSFVWADSSDADFASAAPDQFLVRAAGGVGINKNNPATALDVNGTVTASRLHWADFAELSDDQGGSIELGNSRDTGTVPFIDFHYGVGAVQDYNVRLINNADGQLTCYGGFRTAGSMVVDQSGQNDGAVSSASLTFGTASAEGIASRRTGGDNQFGLDFYTGSFNRMAILNDGRVGINTLIPNAVLTVNGSASKPGGGAWSTFSDARLKKDIRPLAGVLEKLLALRGVTFQYKDPEKLQELAGERTGMIAQEVEKVFPDWVETGADGYKRLTFRGFEALTVEALRDLRAEKDAQISTLEKQNAAQKAINARMEGRLAALENAAAALTAKSGRPLAANQPVTEER